jgi:hypothetical protein
MLGVTIGVLQTIAGAVGLISFIGLRQTFEALAVGAVPFAIAFSALSMIAGTLLMARHRMGVKLTLLVQAPQAFAVAGTYIIYSFSLGPSLLTTLQTSGCLVSLSCYKIATYSSLIEPSLVVQDGIGTIGFGLGVNFVALAVLCLSVWLLFKDSDRPA